MHLIGCDTCNDERELHIDCGDRFREHYTRAIPCPDCVADADDAALDTYLETRLEVAALGTRYEDLRTRHEIAAAESRLELRGLRPAGRGGR